MIVQCFKKILRICQSMSEPVSYNTPREFDSLIKEKFTTGRIKPTFLLSNILFYSIAFYCNMW